VSMKDLSPDYGGRFKKYLLTMLRICAILVVIGSVITKITHQWTWKENVICQMHYLWKR